MLDRVASRLAVAALRLPRARTRRITVRRDIALRVRDGVILRTDHYAPDLPDAPTMLIRTPYGRGGPMRLLCRLAAEQGFHVVIQSCRGTDGSGGTFDPFVHEREDGLDTLDWLRRQRWWCGAFGMFGASYQGFVQWALAADAGEELRAMVAVATASTTRDSTYAGESFALDTVLTWVELLQAQTVPWLARQWELKRGQPRLAAALSHLPLVEADRVATGVTVPFFQEWLRHHTPQADYWRSRVFDDRLHLVRAPVAMVSGWHDIFLPAQLRDYAALRALGARPRLIIGPWTHGSPGLFVAALREGLDWLGTHLTTAGTGRAAVPAAGADRSAAGEPADGPVRIHVGGVGGGWRDLPDWPPPAQATRWYLHPQSALRTAAPVPSPPDGFWYDPADPTPSLGGPLLVAQRSGPVDNRPVEARPDVLTWTSESLTGPLEVIGPVQADIHVRSDLEHFDVFVRLCDVDRRGRSWNICDGLVRIDPRRFPVDGSGAVAVTVPMWPVAHRFAAGHRLRLQLSGGAHPRYVRNPGTGEPLGTAITLRGGFREILHDPERPSAVVLPVVHSGSQLVPS
ncbi:MULTISPECIES: CocE/NonD family hydrolase [Micromonospora]|uniref:Peptidase S15 n=1 Tax=Micromonospora maris TaxID=1003110 RepID=A0A9X0LCY4_9ACTN|nr:MULTISPECIES: CocE/NonD family hydrolase [Micromonospora]AEB46324.1 X-Pro dipeptidyl-peptidase domain-containing protein [Micromonospora maris AB-18-032]KUJ45567.1 peptidase S15 [Micromonospora maris]RUL94374.1 CocE/NonD family hydrolase [Verrucosispora sp. FIM060022]